MYQHLAGIRQQFAYYQSLGEKAMRQVPPAALFWAKDEQNNSIATIVKHLWGNMLSRWTDFLESDGEKPWRDRDAEFENDLPDAPAVWDKWAEGWQVFWQALDGLQAEDLDKIVYIRHQGHTVMEAIFRQLAHYAYHVGQIVVLAKQLADQDWQSLSIPKNASKTFNAAKFAQEPHREHFTEEFIDPSKA